MVLQLYVTRTGASYSADIPRQTYKADIEKELFWLGWIWFLVVWHKRLLIQALLAFASVIAYVSSFSLGFWVVLSHSHIWFC